MSEPARDPFWPYPVAFVAVVLAGLAAGELFQIDRETSPESVDHRVMAWVQAHRVDWPSLTLLARGVTRLGNPDVATTAVLVIALVVYLLHRRNVYRIRRGEALFWIVVAGGGRLIAPLLKLWFQRERPPEAIRLVAEDSFSFPSGHSLFAAVCFTLAAILIPRSLPDNRAWLRWPLGAAVFALALLIAGSRIWLGVHYPTDVLGGFVIGLAWALSTCAIRFGWWRSSGRRPAPDPISNSEI